MTGPLRIQRRRARGWKMPSGTVYVGRGTKYGNPFVVGVDGTRDECIRLYVALSLGYLCISKEPEHIAAQKRVLTALKSMPALVGKDLACWCRRDQVCHADVLLGLANGRALDPTWMPTLSRVN